MKIIGAVVVIIAGGMSGLTVARRYSSRPQELRSIQSALQMLETEIAYAATPLPDALEQIARRCDRSVLLLFERTCEALRSMDGCTAGEAWEKALTEFYRQSSLTGSDLAVLSSFGRSLGISDREDQVKHLHLVMEQMKLQIESAVREAEVNVKIWNYLGFLGGLLVVLIFY